MKRNLDDLIKICQHYLNQKDLKLIKKAYQLSEQAHKNQFRKNKEEYIQHPLNVALTLANMSLDASTITAALLHDTVEDTQIKLVQIEKEFGPEITKLVQGVTKLGQVKLKKDFSNLNLCEKFNPRLQSQLENLRRMFVAMAEDIRVILIRLADRLHNMQTLYALEESKRKRISRETLEIYAPLAHRLGIGEIKGQLEDLAFPYVLPREYRWIRGIAGERYQKRKNELQKMIRFIENALKKENIKIIDIHGRTKHLYSLYKKLLKYDKDISKIYDLMAIRIIAKNKSDCYKILGIMHKIWKPLPGYIKDYISMPKPNGYQSLHTTVFSLVGSLCEIQIRTLKMHHLAENGIAAHWKYKNESLANPPRKIIGIKKEYNWINQLARWQEKINKPEEFKDILKLDFFSDRIFVYTPKGDVKNLPQSATPIDFAYSIHSDIGSHCQGSKVNGKMVSLDYELQNSDIVEIMVSKSAHPRQDWLKKVKTAEARSKIKNFLKKSY